jgi:hypothetical protein
MTERVWEINHLLDYLHDVYLIQYAYSNGPQIDYE